MMIRPPHAALGVLVAAAFMTACQPADGDRRAAGESEPAVEVSTESGAGVVEVIARDYAFDAPDEIASGWTAFRLKNEGEEVHFLLLSLLPEGVTFEEYKEEVARPFDEVWQELKGGLGKAEAGAMLGDLLPAWYGSVKVMGGPGFVAAGGVAETWVRLEPGRYVMECYVKTADGEFHTMLGMARPLSVTADLSGATAPEAALEITLTNDEMAIQGSAVEGLQTVAVHFREHPQIGLGNDVHLVRLEDGTDMDELVRWMDWMNVGGLRTPAPAEFVGGAHEMPVGETSYFTVVLMPGRYAWIAESAAARGFVQEFAVE